MVYQAAKIILTDGQFARCLTLNETPVTVYSQVKTHRDNFY